MMTTNKLVRAIDTAVDLVNHGRYGEAERLTKKVTARVPGSGMAWKLLGAVLAIQGKNEEAVDPLRKAAAFLPNDVEAQANLGSNPTRPGPARRSRGGIQKGPRNQARLRRGQEKPKPDTKGAARAARGRRIKLT